MTRSFSDLANNVLWIKLDFLYVQTRLKKLKNKFNCRNKVSKLSNVSEQDTKHIIGLLPVDRTNIKMH